MTAPRIGDTVYDVNYRWRRGVVVKIYEPNNVPSVRIKTNWGDYLSIVLPNVVVVRRKN